ncbi:MAG: ATP-grasp domain-containing protein, partial [Eubacteriales bacterium]
INNNPETVSTDFDTADRLYFEPLTPEDVTGVVEAEKPDYAIVQFGGQTAINLAAHLEKLGVPILGTPAWSIDAAEDREKFDVILEKCGIPRPAGHTVMTEEEAVKAADELGYPVLVRPSYVLGGQGMEIAYKEADVREFMQVITRNKVENPVLVDKYMMGREIEVDAICDGDDILIPGIMEHFERAGVHSGDSISIYPSINIEQKHKDTLVKYTEALAKNLAVLGLVNIQFVLYNDQIYVIEVNPRSSRTVPYISKVTGVPMVDLATRCMFGEKLKDMGCGTGLHPESDHYAVKVPVFSFQKLRDLDTQLGPEMKSTGEVLGVAKTFREALLKGLTGAGFQMKKKGAVLISVRDSDKQEAIRIGERFEALGFDIYATSGTANVLNRHMVATNSIRNVDEPSPNIIDLIESGKIDYVVATSVKGRHPELGSVHIRRTAVERAIPCLTSMDTVSALLRCLEGDIKIENCEMVDINTI